MASYQTAAVGIPTTFRAAVPRPGSVASCCLVQRLRAAAGALEAAGPPLRTKGTAMSCCSSPQALPQTLGGRETAAEIKQAGPGKAKLGGADFHDKMQFLKEVTKEGLFPIFHNALCKHL